ncbi:UDP-3-O-(3-hydroxymyristoyl)glucosamine N-acyltransferase [Granulicella sp. dw_53]|uniref:UDP-3-O-(3-hydroxymyristoyl)glucosamine N-acyltransferase n=1 Tax=Granulicella sp. dw_53 TaxID=2719792 RepID=UPI001BD25D07|nr:UDP-3-O-(3-hydroxymyristoyl)glucosamine N-acyltransferase [Granulicella sp. dw_53]
MANLEQVAEWVHAEAPAIGVEILRVASLEGATADSIVFAVDRTTLELALRSQAGAVLANVRQRSEELESNPRVVWVADPRYAFAVVAQQLKGRREAGGVHPTSVVAGNVVLGSRTKVGPGAVLEDGVVVGEDCSLGANVTVYAGTVLGDRVVVQAGAVLGSTGFGYARDAESGRYLLFPQQGTLVVEDDVEIGANTTIDRGALGETRIGRGTKIDNLVHIAHNCTIGQDVIIAAQTGISGSSVVEDGAILGGQVGIGEHATVGTGVILGGGAGVLSGKKMRGVGEVFWGRPARPLKEYLKDLARLKRQ